MTGPHATSQDFMPGTTHSDQGSRTPQPTAGATPTTVHAPSGESSAAAKKKRRTLYRAARGAVSPAAREAAEKAE
jgi:hypothetical protein